MGLIKKIKEKSARIIPAVMACGLIASVGMALVTGNAAAADTNATGYFEQYSLLTYIFGVIAAIFTAGTLWLKDFRMAIVALVAAGMAIVSSYLNL